MSTKPNILFILAEDICPNLGCYGDPDAITPNLDALAAEGMLYENATSVAPVCSAARTTLALGVYPQTAGVGNHRSCVVLPPQIKVITLQLTRPTTTFITIVIATMSRVGMLYLMLPILVTMQELPLLYEKSGPTVVINHFSLCIPLPVPTSRNMVFLTIQLSTAKILSLVPHRSIIEIGSGFPSHLIIPTMPTLGRFGASITKQYPQWTEWLVKPLTI